MFHVQRFAPDLVEDCPFGLYIIRIQMISTVSIYLYMDVYKGQGRNRWRSPHLRQVPWKVWHLSTSEAVCIWNPSDTSFDCRF